MGGGSANLTAAEGADTPVYLALLPPGSPNGEFWRVKSVAVWYRDT